MTLRPTRRPLLLALPALLLASNGRAQAPLDDLRGRLTPDTAESFGRFVSDHLDQLLSLRLTIAPEMQPTAEDGRLRMTLEKPERMQITFFGGHAAQSGAFTADGVYRVRGDGMQMGILIYGLDPLPEAEARRARGAVRPIMLG